MAGTLIGHTDRIMTIGYDPVFLYSSSKDKTIRVWNMQIQQYIHILTGFSHSPKLSISDGSY